MSAENTIDELIGSQINDRFLLIESIGSGGALREYKARDEAEDTAVRVKLLSLSSYDRSSIDAYVQIADNISNLIHPNIVDLLDYGIYADKAYVVYPFLGGITLRTAIQERGAFTAEATADLIHTIGDALSSAHSVGIRHDNLSSDSITLLGGFGGTEQAYLGDLGIVSLINTNEKGSVITPAGTILGNPEFLSPEQISDGAVGYRSDIYSLAILTYELLSGKPPFPLASRSPDAIMDVLAQHTTAAPPSIQAVNSSIQIPEEAEALLFQALSKDPSSRPATVSDFANRLGEAIGKSSISFQLPDQQTANPSLESYQKPEVTPQHKELFEQEALSKESEQLPTLETPVSEFSSSPEQDSSLFASEELSTIENPVSAFEAAEASGEIYSKEIAQPQGTEQDTAEQIFNSDLLLEKEEVSAPDFGVHASSPNAYRATEEEFPNAERVEGLSPIEADPFEVEAEPFDSTELEENDAFLEEMPVYEETPASNLGNPLSGAAPSSEFSSSEESLENLFEAPEFSEEEQQEADKKTQKISNPDQESKLTRLLNFVTDVASDRRVAMIGGGVTLALLLLFLSLWPADSEKKNPADKFALTNQGLPSSELGIEGSEINDTEELRAALIEDARVSEEQAKDIEAVVTSNIKVARVELQQILLESVAGASLQKGYLQQYKRIRGTPTEEEDLEELHRLNTQVVKDLLAQLREVIRSYAKQQGILLVVSGEGGLDNAIYTSNEAGDLNALLEEEIIDIHDVILPLYDAEFTG